MHYNFGSARQAEGFGCVGACVITSLVGIRLTVHARMELCGAVHCGQIVTQPRKIVLIQRIACTLHCCSFGMNACQVTVDCIRTISAQLLA